MCNQEFLITLEDFRQLERILNQLADFVTIVYDQKLEDDLFPLDTERLPSGPTTPTQIF